MTSHPPHVIARRAIAHHLLLIPVLSLLLLLLIYGLETRLNKETIVYSQSPLEQNVAVSVSIGKTLPFVIFGYTSPNAQVNLDASSSNVQTFANSKGYFEFVNVFLPASLQEICLSSQDQFGRLSAPVCIPGRANSPNRRIGPILLPPTISLDKQYYYIKDEVQLSGQTIPNSPVELSLFKEFALPPISVNADEYGNYSAQIPSSQTSKYRVFSQTSYLEQETPQSTPLTFSIYPFWMMIVFLIQLILTQLRDRILELILVLEVFAVLTFIYRRTKKKHPLPALLPEHRLAIREEHPLMLSK